MSTSTRLPDVFDELAANPRLAWPERTDLTAHAAGMMTACGIMARALGHAMRLGDLDAAGARRLFHEALDPVLAACNEDGS